MTDTRATKRKDVILALEGPMGRERSRLVESLRCAQDCDGGKSQLPRELRAQAAVQTNGVPGSS